MSIAPLEDALAWELEPPPAQPNGPVWALAQMFPYQGDWSESAFFNLPDNTRIELIDGRLEVLPVPTKRHQLALTRLLRLFFAHLDSELIFPSGYKIRIRPDKMRDPDIIYCASAEVMTEQYATTATLIVEIVSPGQPNHERDFAEKREDYAAARVTHYWIVDPETKTLHVLQLDGDAYRDVATMSEGAFDASAVAEGLVIDVDALFAEETS